MATEILVFFAIGIILLFCIIDSYARSKRLDREIKEIRLRIKYLEKNR